MSKYTTLRDWRMLHFIPQLELSKELEINQATISLIENRIIPANMRFKNAFKNRYGEELYNTIQEFNNGRGDKK